MFTFQKNLVSVLVTIVATFLSAVCYRIIYNLYFHPVAKFPGPWYAASTSLVDAVITFKRSEVEWFRALVEKYGSDRPIRISPNVLLFAKPSALKDIYRDPKSNQKSRHYGTKSYGPPQLVTTLNGEEHRILRKALAYGWGIGPLQKEWEERFDWLIQNFMTKLQERVDANEDICLSDRVCEFAADIMTMESFGQPWGFVKNQRDERHIIGSIRVAFDALSLISRWAFLRDYIMDIPLVMKFFLPSPTDKTGWGYVIGCADKQISEREEQNRNGIFPEQPDFLQYCLDARIDGKPLGPEIKRAHITLLIQAGANTTSTSLACTLRFLINHASKLELARKEIDTAERAGKLSTPIKYEETRNHLPFISACIKESMRLQSPGTLLFARTVPKVGKIIDGFFIPEGTDITSHAGVVHRDAELYSPDPNEFRPERWLESTEQTLRIENANFVFGTGPRTCLGKNIALMELHKLIPEIIRRFDMEMVQEGTFHITGIIAYNDGLLAKLTSRGR